MLYQSIGLAKDPLKNDNPISFNSVGGAAVEGGQNEVDNSNSHSMTYETLDEPICETLVLII